MSKEELIKLGARSTFRKDSLLSILHLLSDEILKNDDLCNKAFRIYEEKYFNDYYGKEESIFKIQEIRVETDFLKIANIESNYQSNEKR